MDICFCNTDVVISMDINIGIEWRIRVLFSVFSHLNRNSLTIHGDLMDVYGSRWRCHGCLWIDIKTWIFARIDVKGLVFGE